MSASQLALLSHDWRFWARKEQLPPAGDWRTWLFMGGRGAGKTRAGAEWVSELALSGRAGRIALVGPTFHDVRDANIDVIGVDWYAPLSDWRDGEAHLDAEISRSIYDLDYLEARIEAGEHFEWHYTSDSDRAAQQRTSITDEDYGEPWVHRAKDLRSFWSLPHHDRPGGVRSPTPTPWTPRSKPIWLIELGCPAVDKGANAPNVFVDPKSSESALPFFSLGARDDLIQRRTLEAYLRRWAAESAANPVSPSTGRPMIEAAFLWCWDARPYPAFPARADVWADGPSWRLGHWLNGRGALSNLGEVVRDLCARAGVHDVDATALTGAVSGYVVDGPSSVRAGLEPLMAAYDFTAVEREGKIVFLHRGDDAANLTMDDIAAEGAAEPFATRGDPAEISLETRVRFLDSARDYLMASVSARRLDSAVDGVEVLDAPLVLEGETAERLAQRLLLQRRAETETLQLDISPARLELEPGDRLRFADSADAYKVVRTDDAETRRLELRRVRPTAPVVNGAEPAQPPAPSIAPTPVCAVLDLPPLPGKEDDERPLVAVFASPWLGEHYVYVGEAAQPRAVVERAAIMGELATPLWAGPVGRWDEGNSADIIIYGGALASVSASEALSGANVFAIQSGDEWEVLQARSCVLVGAGTYRISGLLRGQLGSAHAMRNPHPAGARVVKIDERLVRMDVGAHEWKESLSILAPPSGALSSDARAAAHEVVLPHAARRPWAPAHLGAVRQANGDVAISWIRTASIGGDAWSGGEPPIGAPTEAYRLEILDEEVVRRAVEIAEPHYLYTAAEQLADFQVTPGSFRVRVAQIDGSGAPGLNKELTITL